MSTNTMRQGIPHVDDFIHLNNAAGSLADQRVHDAIKAHLELEARSGSTEAMNAVSSKLEQLYSAVAAFVGGTADQMLVADSHTNAWQRPFLAVDLKPGDVVLVGSSEWGGNLSMIHHTCRRTGASYKVVPDDASGRMDLRTFESALKDKRVKLVCTTWVAATSGQVNPVEEIGELMRQTEALHFVDGAQAIGQFPVDIRNLNCDLLTVSARKFVRGPRGTGFAWISKRFLNEYKPLGVDQFAAPWENDAPHLRGDARRFETGESNYAARLGLLSALELILTRDISADFTVIKELAAQARARLSSTEGITVLEGNEGSCGLVTFLADGVAPAKIAADLRQSRINISAPTTRYGPLYMAARGWNAINRLSPHAFNTADEIDKACDAIATSVKS
ncbi:aminotransferase class V-fold PLP-dependent enzyme [Stappia sp. F7233]|uniref:Aminotransferase class V-fold PLP-dependent enzyme n=1 Tax=Stappia albiluteola TaxID=2758565 RepID=A0A839AE67_9HYPH|nr:aminotransferase class V-fold PLP-dependent enzyme [Stappia albiluteola]MBA5777328.1 aminotransferase class V-fold PLP-dependent enzyme [Stappia albiluteola]